MKRQRNFFQIAVLLCLCIGSDVDTRRLKKPRVLLFLGNETTTTTTSSTTTTTTITTTSVTTSTGATTVTTTSSSTSTVTTTVLASNSQNVSGLTDRSLEQKNLSVTEKSFDNTVNIDRPVNISHVINTSRQDVAGDDKGKIKLSVTGESTDSVPSLEGTSSGVMSSTSTPGTLSTTSRTVSTSRTGSAFWIVFK